MTGPADRNRHRRGVALVVVLWGLVLIAIIASGVALGARTDAQMAFNVAESAKARALAEAGIQRGVLEVVRRDESVWLADGTVYPVSAPGGEIAVSLQDELGRIDLNTAPDELMSGLFASVGQDDDAARALADAVADWRDEDDLVRLNGAEARDYRAAGLAHEPKNAPFEAIEELRLVLGMSEALYRLVAGLVTVHSRRPWVNLATAPIGVLMALPGLDGAARESILESREPIGVRENADEPAPRPMPPAVAPTRFGRVIPTGGVVSIRSVARTEAGGVFVREAIVRATGRSETPYEYLGWKQGRREPSARPDADGEPADPAGADR